MQFSNNVSGFLSVKKSNKKNLSFFLKFDLPNVILGS